MKTGNTGGRDHPGDGAVQASMEPGHEDREYTASSQSHRVMEVASMEPGHEDREYFSKTE